MRYVWNILLKGLAAVLPVGLTLYLVYWLAISIERVIRPVITIVIPEHYYWPGMGLVAGMVLLFFIGLEVNAWIVRRMIGAGEELLEHIPLVKSVYGTLRDFMGYFSTMQKRHDLKQVVMVTVNDVRLMGFLTAEQVEDIPDMTHPEDMVAVYLPMSFQIGGYTVYVPRSRVEAIDMSVEDAMRRIITANLSKAGAAHLNKPI
jgi:uncharacterized membrane protein